MTIVILAASIVLQLAAATVALAIIRISGRRLTWILIAGALVLMAVRRVVTLWTVLAVPGSVAPSLPGELTALAASCLILAAVFCMRSTFLEMVEVSEEAARQRKRFQDYAESASDWFWESDEAHRYTWFSERAGELAEFPCGWDYGKPRGEPGEPADAEAARAAHQARLAAREPFRDVEFHRVGPEGERWIRCSGAPVFDERGQFRGYRGTGSDITALKLAERSYEAVRDQLAKAIESMSEGIAIFGPDGRLVLCNEHIRRHNPWLADRFVPGAKHAELVALYAEVSLPPGTSPAQRAAWRAERLSLRDRPGGSMEFQIRDGSWCRISEYQTEDGGMVTLRTDITELKRRQFALEWERNRAEAASRSKSEFLANMSHELRTPLNAIIGFSDVMTSGLLGEVPEKFRSYAEDISKSGRHLLDLISDLLDLAKIETGRLELYEEAFELGPELSDILVMTGPQRAAKGISLEENLAAVGPGTALFADRRALRQILINLLSNATKFTPERGRIAFAVALTGEDLEIAIRDSGIGIAAEDQERVFDRFVQLGSVIDRQHGGAGIGLPLSRALAELHGGRVALSSAKGEGTVVTLTLPGRLRRKKNVA